MVLFSDPDLSWAVHKAVLILLSAVASVACLAWVAARKTLFK